LWKVMRSATVMGTGGWPLMTTAGRRPDSMREMRAARVGSGVCGAERERLEAESLGEKKEELEAAITRNAKVVVRSRKVLVVDFMGELMGRNRITFEGGAIRLVG
jgi:hypothetical protein